MRRIIITVLGWAAMTAWIATAGTFPLTDGTKITGSPASILDKGVVFHLEDGSDTSRIEWDKFTPEAIKALMAEAKTDNERALLEPMVENLPQEVAKRKEIVVKPVQTPERPKHGVGVFGLFGSPVGWMMFLVLYAANLFAAYEVCIYRRLPAMQVCGLAAIPFIGVLSPIIFGAMPTRALPPESTDGAEAAQDAPVPLPGQSADAPAPATPAGTYAASEPVAGGPGAAPAPDLPKPVVFQRGEFSFNRRFFETKFAGYFRLVPSEAEKDMVLVIEAARGRYVGRRIMRITPNELYLQITANNASADEMIPFVEISEVQIRHKDSL